MGRAITVDAHQSDDTTVKLLQSNVEQVIRGDWVAAVRGITIISVDENELVIAQEIDQSDVNGVGVAHGGVLYTIADSAAGLTANALDPGTRWLTESATIHYQTLVHRGERVTATCKLVMDGEGARRFETIIRNETDEVVAVLDSILQRIAP